MLPYIHLFGREIPTYSVMAVIGVLLAIVYWKLRQKHYSDLTRDMELIFIYSILGAAVGSKLLYILIELPDLIRDVQSGANVGALLTRYFAGGFVFYGGLYGCVGAAWLYCRGAKISFDRTVQAFLPMFPLVHGFGRVGCFAIGCCYGGEAGDFPLSVTFRNSPVAPNGVALYPVQILEAVAEWLLFFLLARFSRKDMPGKRMLGIYGVSYALMRFILEFFRGDEYRGFFLGLSTSQLISVLTAAIGVALIVKSGNDQKA